jgi:hypothetical protein
MSVAAIVESKELIETVIASVIGGIGVTFVFSIAIWGAARFTDLSRSDRPLAAAAAATVAGLALAVTLGGLVLGIVVMTSK